jgi:hypothetical protein
MKYNSIIFFLTQSKRVQAMTERKSIFKKKLQEETELPVFKEDNLNFFDSNFDDSFGKINVKETIHDFSDTPTSKTKNNFTQNLEMNNENDDETPVTDEIPLMEELGIDFKLIFKNILFVLNPNKNKHLELKDLDLGGILFLL